MGEEPLGITWRYSTWRYSPGRVELQMGLSEENPLSRATSFADKITNRKDQALLRRFSRSYLSFEVSFATR
jgi:hypothetical protein